MGQGRGRSGGVVAAIGDWLAHCRKRKEIRKDTRLGIPIRDSQRETFFLDLEVCY